MKNRYKYCLICILSYTKKMLSKHKFNRIDDINTHKFFNDLRNIQIYSNTVLFSEEPQLEKIFSLTRVILLWNRLLPERVNISPKLNNFKYLNSKLRRIKELLVCI